MPRRFPTAACPNVARWDFNLALSIQREKSARVAYPRWDTSPVIPTMLLGGLVIGRWWAIPLGGIVWAAIVALAASTSLTEVSLAAALGAANVAIGVLIRWAVAWLTGRALSAVRPPA